MIGFVGRRAQRALLVLALVAGCFGGGSRGGGGGEATSGGEMTSGTLTFENASGEPVCGVELQQRDHYAAHTGRLEPGESAELEVQSEAEYLFVTACSGDRFLRAGPVTLEGSTYTFSDPEPKTFEEHLAYLREINQMNQRAAMQDPALEAQLHESVLERARSQRWEDEPSVTRIVSDDWAIARNRLTGVITHRRIAAVVGHRFPDGHCTFQIHTFAQHHDGNGFSGAVRYEGTAHHYWTGCSLVTWLEGGDPTAGASSGGSASASASAGGGSCTNTCSSANDGECDDGGPGAQYDVCALGTDCADCGPRGGSASATASPSGGGSCTNTCSSANDG
ncbi:MAG TPA: hypothetical protein RMG45_03145, partial [Polyangiaceae bacterium LLY-WYZ-15_(1-7)]|nr:hypothetical protein [Polyangiaceae bacterium LLY-WYZ-15_(1-7)]